jgi:hypothetical protein
MATLHPTTAGPLSMLMLYFQPIQSLLHLNNHRYKMAMSCTYRWDLGQQMHTSMPPYNPANSHRKAPFARPFDPKDFNAPALADRTDRCPFYVNIFC